jgi:glutathione S-transferase
VTDELVFYTNPNSRGRTVRWMLEEVGQPYRTELLDYPAMKSPVYLGITPMGKVPALTHGGVVVTETAAICAYLADAFPQAGLAPPSASPLRAAYYRWLFFIAGPVEAAITNKALGLEVSDSQKRLAGYGCLADTLSMVEHAVSAGDHLVGETFTTADLMLAAQLGFGMMFGLVEKRPAFERFVQATTMRPAAIHARRIDDALIGTEKS